MKKQKQPKKINSFKNDTIKKSDTIKGGPEGSRGTVTTVKDPMGG